MQNEHGIKVALQPRHALQVLGALVLMLVAAHIGCQLLLVHYGPEYAKSMVRLFDLDGEGNLPTLFSTGLFVLNAILFHIAWRSSVHSGRRENFWSLMSVVFLLLGIDEIGALHEHLIRPIREMLPGTAGGIFRFAWVIPYGILAVVATVLCVPVLRRMGPRLAAFFALAGAVYVVGAAVMEMLGGRYLEVTQQAALDRSPAYVMLTTIEETMEMAGLVLCIYALLSLLQERYGGFAISLEANPGSVSAPAKSAGLIDPPAMQWRRWLVVLPKNRTGAGAPSGN